MKNYDLSSVQMLACGAAPVSAELTDQLTKVLPNALIGQGYGVSHLSYPLFFIHVCIDPQG